MKLYAILIVNLIIISLKGRSLVEWVANEFLIQHVLFNVRLDYVVQKINKGIVKLYNRWQYYS